jgi:hypothetical protein
MKGGQMIKEEDFAAAADVPPDMAFVRLERKFREILEENLESSQSGNASDHFIIEYMNHTLATAEALGLDFLDFYTVPDDNSSNVYDSYKRFRQTVDGFTVRIQISHIRLGPAHTSRSMPTRRSISAPTSLGSKKLLKPHHSLQLRRSDCSTSSTLSL